MKKQFITAGIATAVGVAGLVGVGVANAETSTSGTGTHPMSSLVEAISSKFNLDKTKVQAVFDEQHTKMEAERAEQVKTELTKLVSDGKLTQDQMDKIVAKRAELEKDRAHNRTAHQSLSDAERDTKRQERKTALETWAKENNIPTEYLRYVMGGGRGHGGHGGDESMMHQSGRRL